MEEKKAKISNSFRAFSGSKFLNSSFFPASVKPTIFTSVKLKSKGFTLVEILIVIAIIGTLVGAFITLLDPGNQIRGARDSKRKSNLQQIRTALELYRTDCSVYPASLGNSISSSCTGSPIAYLQSVPKDPKTNASYTYSPSAALSNYQLIACLERTNDPEGSGTCAGGSGRNYTVTNP